MFLKIPINNTCHIITNLCNKDSDMLLTPHAETASAVFWFYFFYFILFIYLFFIFFFIFHALIRLVSSVL